MEDIILYSTGSPRCRSLKQVLDGYGIEYVENTSMDDIVAMDIIMVPVLQVGKKMMRYDAAVKWASEHRNK